MKFPVCFLSIQFKFESFMLVYLRWIGTTGDSLEAGLAFRQRGVLIERCWTGSELRADMGYYQSSLEIGTRRRSHPKWSRMCPRQTASVRSRIGAYIWSPQTRMLCMLSSNLDHSMFNFIKTSCGISVASSTSIQPVLAQKLTPRPPVDTIQQHFGCSWSQSTMKSCA